MASLFDEYKRKQSPRDRKRLEDHANMARLFGQKMARAGVWVTLESLYSVTPHHQAMEVASIIHDWMKGRDMTDMSITDGTANVGGDTMALMSLFHRVRSIEYDKATYLFLKHNLETFVRINRHEKEIDARHGDITDPKIIDSLGTSALFLDPPWGGPEYKGKDQVHLILGGEDFSQVVDRALRNNPSTVCVWIKAPLNTHVDMLLGVVEGGGYDMAHWDIKRTEGRNRGTVMFRLWCVSRKVDTCSHLLDVSVLLN